MGGEGQGHELGIGLTVLAAQLLNAHPGSALCAWKAPSQALTCMLEDSRRSLFQTGLLSAMHVAALGSESEERYNEINVQKRAAGRLHSKGPRRPFHQAHRSRS